MSPQQLSKQKEATELARQCLDAIRDGSYVDRFADLVHPDFLWKNEFTGETVEGPGGWVQYTAGWLAGFPNMNPTLLESKPSDAGATCRITWAGTFTGTMMTPDGNVAGNGKKLFLDTQIDVGVKDGKVVSWIYSQDPAEIMRQLGLA